MTIQQDHPDLHRLVVARFEQSMSVPEAFFATEAGRIAEACWAMARRFFQGGRLLAFGNGAWATDAQHVSVEFVHPVIVGKRALPALALTNDSATLSGLMAGADPVMSFARQLKVLARPQDMAMGFSPDGRCANVVVALKTARQMGLLTLGLVGGDGGLIGQMGQTELDAEGHCVTCSDEALTARVLRVDSETGLALVEIMTEKLITEEIDITLVDSVDPGDLLLVHGGVAIANL